MNDMMEIALWQRDELARLADKVHAYQMVIAALGISLTIVTVGFLIALDAIG